MRQKPCHSESALERRTDLYVQATIITTISNHRYSQDGVYRGETEHESSPTTPTAATRLTAEAAAAAALPTRLWPPPPPPPPTTTEALNNRACSDVEAGGLRPRPTPLPSLPRDFLSPVVSVHPVWEHRATFTYSCSVIAASVRVHASGPRHKLILPVVRPFLIGRMFLREPSWKYSAKLVGS